MPVQSKPIQRLAVVRADRRRSPSRPQRRRRAVSLPPGPAPGEARFEYLKRTYD